MFMAHIADEKYLTNAIEWIVPATQGSEGTISREEVGAGKKSEMVKNWTCSKLPKN